MIVKMIQDRRKRMEAKIEKMKEMFNKDLEQLKRVETGLRDTGSRISEHVGMV